MPNIRKTSTTYFEIAMALQRNGRMFTIYFGRVFKQTAVGMRPNMPLFKADLICNVLELEMRPALT